MAKEVSPELLSDIQEYTRKRQKGEKELLSFFYKEVFGVDLKVNCGACIEEGFFNLETVITRKTKPVMENFKWKGGKATAAIRKGDSVVLVSEANCDDELAELLECSGKYSHLVERVGGSVKVVEEKKSVQEAKETYTDLEVTILTSKEVKTEEEPAKKKRGRPKSK